jgi:DNA repair exonuclease SbcCD nuclease subunit
MKIGVFADTHVGRCIPVAIGDLRRRAYRHAFTEAIDVFIEEGTDCVIHAGDLFEKRSMTPEDTVFVKDELQRLVTSIHSRCGKEIPVFIVRGNHDGVPENNALDYVKHPLATYLRIIGDDVLVGKEETQAYEGLCLLGVGYHPYISRRFESLKPTIRESFAGKKELKLLVIHNFIEGYHPIPPGVPEHNYLTMRDFDDLGLDVVVAGHYHGRIEPLSREGTVFLTPGATEAVDLSDKGPYGVSILEGKDSMRFVPIKPLHDILSVKVDSEQAVRPVGWFVQRASNEANRYASDLQMRGSEGVLRLVLLGLTDEDPYNIDLLLAAELEKTKRASSRLLYVDLNNRVESAKQPVVLPALEGGIEFAGEMLSPFGSSAPEAMRIVEETSTALDEKASQKTGVLTDTDRMPFVGKWIDLIERTVKQA